MPSQRVNLGCGLQEDEIPDEASAGAISLVFVDSAPVASSTSAAKRQIRVEPLTGLGGAVAEIATKRPDLLLIRVAALHQQRLSAESMPLPQRPEQPEQCPPWSSSSTAIRSQSEMLRSLLAMLRQQDRQLPIIIAVPPGEGAGQAVVDAIEAGATDVVSEAAQPDDEREKIISAIERRRLQKRPTVRIHQAISERHNNLARSQPAIICGSDVMVDALCAVARVAKSRFPLLIHGEPGTGKSLLAQTLHRYRGGDASALVIDCGHLQPERVAQSLVEDSQCTMRLRPELCGRTLIIENVDRACERTQWRLLAALRHHMRDTGALAEDAPRIVITCSTAINSQLLHNESSGPDPRNTRLLAELFYELCGTAIEMPPLRDRGDDVELLIKYFVRSISGTEPVDEAASDHRVTSDAKEALLAYDWPGNVTQLRSVVLSEIVHGEGIIALGNRLSRLLRFPPCSAKPNSLLEAAPPGTPIQLNRQQPPELSSASAWTAAVERAAADNPLSDENATLYSDAIQAVEAGLIAAVLDKTDGNLAQSARLLGITRVSLRRKIHALRLQIPGRMPIS